MLTLSRPAPLARTFRSRQTAKARTSTTTTIPISRTSALSNAVSAARTTQPIRLAQTDADADRSDFGLFQIEFTGASP